MCPLLFGESCSMASEACVCRALIRVHCMDVACIHARAVHYVCACACRAQLLLDEYPLAQDGLPYMLCGVLAVQVGWHPDLRVSSDKPFHGTRSRITSRSTLPFALHDEHFLLFSNIRPLVCAVQTESSRPFTIGVAGSADSG
jgi:hypothetical protein